MISFVLLKHMSARRRLQNATTITRTFAALEYVLKIVIATKSQAIEHPLAFIQSHYRENFPFTSLISAHSAFKSISLTETSMPVFIGDINNLSYHGSNFITPPQIRSFVKGLITHCEESLRSLLQVDQLIQVPSLNDDFRDLSTGTSLYKKNRHIYLEGERCTMQSRVLACANTLIHYHHLDSDGRLCLEAVKTFYHVTMQKFARDLAVCLHLTGGCPARKTELATLRVSNSHQAGRGIFWVGTQFVYVLSYKKTSQQRKDWDPVYRFLPAKMNNLLFTYLCICLPALDYMMARAGCDEQPSSLLVQTKNPARPTEISQRFESHWKNHFNFNMSFGDWRQLIQLYMREIMTEVTARNQMAGFIDNQAGRSVLTGVMRYGVSTTVLQGIKIIVLIIINVLYPDFFLYPIGTTPTDMESNRLISNWWHEFLFVESSGERSIPLVPAPSASYSNTHCIPQPQLEPPPISYANQNVDTAICLVHLKRLFGDQAQFKSAKQIEMVARAAAATDDLVIQMPTGHGKSLSYLLPAIMQPGETSLVFCPLVSLLGDTLRKCEALGVSVSRWEVERQRTECTTVVLVHYQLPSIHVKDLQFWISRNVSNGKIRRIIFDEAHVLTSWDSFMNMSHLPYLRGTQRVQLIFQSATLPDQVVQSILARFFLRKENVRFITEFEPRQNLQFEM